MGNCYWSSLTLIHKITIGSSSSEFGSMMTTPTAVSIHISCAAAAFSALVSNVQCRCVKYLPFPKYVLIVQFHAVNPSWMKDS